MPVSKPLFGFEWSETALPSEVERSLLTIAARDFSGDMHTIGTGFFIKATIHASLAVSAAHVFTEIRRLQQSSNARSHFTALPEFSPPPPPIRLALAGLTALTRSRSGNTIFFSVDGLAFDNFADFGVLQLSPQSMQPTPLQTKEFLLEDAHPQVGQLVCIAGYAEMADQIDTSGALTAHRRAVLRFGKVLNVFPDGQRLCRGPCVETSIPIFSGMSGSPVFYYDATGAMRVFGLACSDPDIDGPQKNDRTVSGHSIAALLPVKRISGTTNGRQVVAINFVPTSVAGIFQDFGTGL
jgi:hypothetical protein